MIKRIKEKNAITLLALIITVIVLLILATVSISLIINSGILDHAQHGVDRYSEEEELEQIKLAVASAQLKGNGFLTTENLNSELQDRFGEEAIQSINGWRFKDYNIKEDGEVNKSLLPSEYQQVEYIESTGTQYINTKIYPKSTTKVEFDFALTKGLNGWGSSGSQEAFLWGANTETQKFQTSVSNKWILIQTNIDLDQKRHIFILCNGCQSIDGDIYGNTTIGNTATSTQFMYLFATHVEWKDTGADYFCKQKLFKCTISEDENLKRNFIPCYTTTTVTDVDGVERPKDTIGLYDTVEGKFYVNKGTGTFLKGADV